MSRGEKSLDIELSRLGFKDGQYTTDPVDLLVFDRDAGIDRGTPEAVVFPESTQEVVRLVNWARQNRIPLVARGAGTGLTGGAVAETGGVILQFSRLNRLVQVDLEGRAVVFQPGVVNGVLDQLLKERDWYYPPDPGSGRSATMGGTIAENAGGPHCLKYGVTGNYINGMRVVLSNGATLQLGGTALDYPETDFVGLLTGSEGTLAIITEATARIVRRPPAVETLMVAFDSVEACGNAVSAVIAAGIIPATLEMMDQKIVRIVENYAHAGLPVEAEAVLIVEVDGYASSVSPQMEEIAEVLKRCGAYDFRPAKTEEERARIWNARKGAGGAITRLAPAYYPADATVSRSKLAATLIAINRICDEANLRVGYAVHAGDGNLHPHILIEDPTDQDLLSRVQAAGAKVMEWCVAAGGSITGEHGVGIEKRSFLSLMYNTAELQAMRDVKEVFDPVNILNPGKILPASKSWPDPPESGSRTLEGPATIKAVASSLAPSSAEEAAEAFRQWNQATGDLRVRIQGGGTKSSLLPEAGNVVSTACLKGVTECAPHDLYVSVRAGTTLEELRQELEGTGMQVPLASPWPDATIGGIVSSNFNGPLRCLYGGLRDLLLSVTAVLPDGRVLRLGRPFAKDVAGYDLKKLFIGARGSLGLLTDVTLRLFPLPRLRQNLVISVPDAAEGLRGAKIIRDIYRLCSGLVFAGSPCSLVCTLEGLPEEVDFEASLIADRLSAEGLTGITQSAESSTTDAWCNFLAGTGPETTTFRLGIPFRAVGSVLQETVRLADTECFADLANGLVYLRMPAESASRRPVVEATCSNGGYALMIGGPARRFRPEEMYGYEPDSAALTKALRARWDPRGIMVTG